MNPPKHLRARRNPGKASSVDEAPHDREVRPEPGQKLATAISRRIENRVAARLAMLLILCLSSALPGYAEESPKAASATENKLEPGEPVLLPAWLSGLHGDIRFTADSIDTEGLEVSNVRLPVSLKGDRIELFDGRASSGAGEVRLEGDYNFSDNILQLQLSGDSLSFDDEDEAEDTSATSDRLIFGDESLLPGWLKIMDGRLTLDVDIVMVDEMPFRGVKGPILFDDSGFEANLIATLGDGNMSVRIDHEYAGERTSITAGGRDINLGSVSVTREYFEGAPTSFEMELQGQGTTERAFASSLSGFIQIKAGPGKIIKTEVDKLAQNIFAITFSSLLRFHKEAPQSVLDCAALRLVFTDGRAETEHGIVVRTQKIVIVGGGVVDINQESLDLKFKPHVRQGIKMKTGGAVDLVLVRGPMSAPDLKVKAGGLLRGGLSLGAAWATFGLSKAAEAVFDWNTRADIACEFAVEN